MTDTPADPTEPLMVPYMPCLWHLLTGSPEDPHD